MLALAENIDPGRLMRLLSMHNEGHQAQSVEFGVTKGACLARMLTSTSTKSWSRVTEGPCPETKSALETTESWSSVTAESRHGRK